LLATNSLFVNQLRPKLRQLTDTKIFASVAFCQHLDSF